jgi:hypothetical protein
MRTPTASNIVPAHPNCVHIRRHLTTAAGAGRPAPAATHRGRQQAPAEHRGRQQAPTHPVLRRSCPFPPLRPAGASGKMQGGRWRATRRKSWTLRCTWGLIRSGRRTQLAAYELQGGKEQGRRENRILDVGGIIEGSLKIAGARLTRDLNTPSATRLGHVSGFPRTSSERERTAPKAAADP